MANNEAKFSENQPSKTQKLFIGGQIFLRIVAIVASVASSWLMITSKQVIDIGGIVLDARYSYSPEFKFLAFTNIVVGCFSLLSLLFLVLVVRQGSHPNHYFFLFLHDLGMMSLVVGGCAAATTVGFLGKHGNSHTGWMQICDNFGKFCNRATTSVTISYLNLICLLILTITSASKSRKMEA
ncbi:PREDICTED: CASP-like protein 1F1 [Populus euphratica]|uniref:CASP-like protein n=1 Tax=Populus euphratica TaxID=75702 RepID=A0AAJ6SZV5_POPEU|nr:PREDICTED: CASP-like protein 1F1 [Populus euphratica]